MQRRSESFVYPKDRKSICFEECKGYQRLTYLWSTIVASKVTEALLAAGSSSIHSAKETLLDLSTEQVMILTLIHSLIKKDTAACFALSEISTKIESLKSPHLLKWLQNEFSFSCTDIRAALSFSADLAKAGLAFPEVILTMLENLYFLYCSSKKNESMSKPERPSELKITLSQSAESLFEKKRRNRQRHKNQVSQLKYTSLIPDHILGEYCENEKTALQKENEETLPKSPLTPKFLNLVSPKIPDTGVIFSKELIHNEETYLGLSANYDNLTDLYEKTGDSALHLAVARDSEEAVHSLLKKGATVDLKNKAGLTPLQIAIERGNVSIIKRLLTNGADVLVRNENGESLLHIVASLSHPETVINEIMTLLIEKGADVNVKDNRGQTPIFRAVKKGNLKVMERLENLGADIYVLDKFERSLIHYAAWHGQLEALDWLQKVGLRNINAKTKHGWTPLHWAVANRQFPTVQYLLQEGADVNARDTTNRTPLYWATDAGSLTLTNLLKSYGGVC